MMASAAKWRDDISGAIVTGGTSTAYTVASNQSFDSLTRLANQMIAFTPHATNGATVTLNVDGLGAKPLRSAPSVELQAGTLIQGTPYVATYNNSDAVWYLQNFYGNPYNVPLAGGMDYWGTTVPNSSFAFPAGQAISRSTYATLFAIMGTTHGTGDGSTTFNLPDKTGRVSAMKEFSSLRLTSSYFGGNSLNIGSVGGAESDTLVTANLPPYTPSGSITNGAITLIGGTYNTSNFYSVNISGSNPVIAALGSLSASQAASTFTGNAQGGTSTPIRTVPPTIICNYIIRII
ncbi:tail fiber protein [Bradyrhizobium japonicum]|uniref:tail fiber protein n=1 Tax=Bradyrhizobium japonicum TaxID=375 RepID=UPI002714C5CD|nr:tail fiber protein [Bradyrhizobium japonicum]WLB18934.1 tail fiber protein [Bradyrhizobium japonicum]